MSKKRNKEMKRVIGLYSRAFIIHNNDPFFASYTAYLFYSIVVQAKVTPANLKEVVVLFFVLYSLLADEITQEEYLHRRKFDHSQVAQQKFVRLVQRSSTIAGRVSAIESASLFDFWDIIDYWNILVCYRYLYA